MLYHERYINLRGEIWLAFESLVKKGANFPELIDVIYPSGVNPTGLSITSEGDSWFYAKALVANQDYKLHEGEDLIVTTGEVTFIDNKGYKHQIEPNIVDLDWLARLLDDAK